MVFVGSPGGKEGRSRDCVDYRVLSGTQMDVTLDALAGVRWFLAPTPPGGNGGAEQAEDCLLP